MEGAKNAANAKENQKKDVNEESKEWFEILDKLRI